MFVFNNLFELAKWLNEQGKALAKQADAERNVRRKAFASGESHAHLTLANLMENGQISLGCSPADKSGHEPHCPVPRAAARGENAVCLCRRRFDPECLPVTEGAGLPPDKDFDELAATD